MGDNFKRSTYLVPYRTEVRPNASAESFIDSVGHSNPDCYLFGEACSSYLWGPRLRGVTVRGKPKILSGSQQQYHCRLAMDKSMQAHWVELESMEPVDYNSFTDASEVLPTINLRAVISYDKALFGIF